MDWICKNKRLPPLGEFDDISIYVIVTDGKMIGYGNYDFDSKRWNYNMIGYVEQNNDSITHWMFFPKLPKNK